MRISKEKREKISEQILSFLYSISPRSAFTAHIASEIARDEEFTKKLLIDLRKNHFVVEIRKNPLGISYSRRSRWNLSDTVYQIYKNKNNS